MDRRQTGRCSTAQQTTPAGAHSPGSPPHAGGEPRGALFDLRRAGDLQYGVRGDEGLAVIAPLPLGVTLAGLEDTDAQRTFLEFLGGGHVLVAYDQRAGGGSGGTLANRDATVLGEDLWAVADAAGVQRAVIYGVLDAGYTAIEAARQQPARVLGLICNFVPPAFGATPGLTEATLASWLRADGDLSPSAIWSPLGIGPSDVEAFDRTWQPATAGEGRERLRLVRSIDPGSLRDCEAPGLILEPLRRHVFSGWGAALARQYPQGRVVQTTRGAQALGAIDAFLMQLTAREGQHASRLSPRQSRAFSVAAQSARELRVIVVPVEEQISSARAVDLACRLAEAQDATIVLASVQVVPRVRALDNPAPETIARATEVLRVAEAVAARRDARYRSEMSFARGYIDGIVRTARTHEADLIVLPNPRSELGGRLDDQALHELFTQAPCEVLIDRGRTLPPPERST